MAGTIFINYRRGENLRDARHLKTLLDKHFGARKVFLDVDGIDGGEDWLQKLETRVAESDAMVALIGDGWADVKDRNGNRRLDQSNDFVRFELAQAINRKIPILPVLFDGALLPEPAKLPPDITPLLQIQSMELRTEKFPEHAEAVAQRLKNLIAQRARRGVPARTVLAYVAAALVAGILAGAIYAGYAGFGASPSDILIRAERRAFDSEQVALRQLATAQRERDQEQKEHTSTKTALAGLQKQLGEEPTRQKGELATAIRERDQAQKDLASTQKQLTEALLPKSLDKTTFRDSLTNGQPCPFCPALVIVPSGKFVMGSPAGEAERQEGENQVDVTLGKSFAVGRFLITRGEYATFVSDTNRKIDEGCYRFDSTWSLKAELSWQSPGFVQDDRHPVACVNGDDVQAYVSWLNGKTGKVYRLLSEAEFEYVARAGSRTAFWWGGAINPSQANYFGPEAYKGGGTAGEFRSRTVAVDTFAANPWGLHDVHGNLLELTEDCWSEGNVGNPGDGSPRTTGDCSKKVVRGGAWNSFARNARSAYRTWAVLQNRAYNQGFRVARSL